MAAGAGGKIRCTPAKLLGSRQDALVQRFAITVTIFALRRRQELPIWWARQQAAAIQGASKLAHSKGAPLECGSLLPPSFGEACFASRDHRLYTHEVTGNTLLP